MTTLTALQEHRQVCDDLYQLALEENRHLRQHQRAPEAAAQERKRGLLERLDHTLEALRVIPAASVRAPEIRRQLEDCRARILQILQLDKENEQLLLRCSLTSNRPPPGTAPSASTTLLQRIYSRSA